MIIYWRRQDIKEGEVSKVDKSNDLDKEKGLQYDWN
jgi:hypothetical protein